MVIDGYITSRRRLGPGVLYATVEIPTARQVTGQLFLGRGGEKRRELAEQAPRRSSQATCWPWSRSTCWRSTARPCSTSRSWSAAPSRRVLAQDELVRGPFVRPPVDPWVGSWRSQGFRAMAYKEANSRYRPGAVADDWAVAQIPKR
jgi:hypothetical protein